MSRPCDPEWDREPTDCVQDKALAALERPVTMFEAPDVLADIHRQVAKSPAPRRVPAMVWAACGLALVIAGSLVPRFSGQQVGKDDLAMAPEGYVVAPPRYEKAPVLPKKTPLRLKKPKAVPRAKPRPEPTRFGPRHIDHFATAGGSGRSEAAVSHPEASYLIVCAPEPMPEWSTPDTATSDTAAASAVTAPGATGAEPALEAVPMDSYDIRMTDTNTGTVTSLSVTNTLNSDGTEESHIDYSVAEPPTRPGTLPTDRSLYNENSLPDHSGVSMRAAG